jgi:hypothetical protein
MTGGVIGSNRRPPPMFDGHARAVSHGFEAHLDFGDFVARSM